MNKLNELKTTAEVVKHILETFTASRNDDHLLFYLVCSFVNKDVVGKSFGDVLIYRNDYKLPAFETVRRTRQKVQAENPHLAADKEIKAMREANEDAFKEYARS